LLTGDLLTAATGNVVVKSGTQTVTSSTTLVDDSELKLTVPAITAKYLMLAYLLYDGALDPAGGLKMQFTGPGTMTWTNFGANISAPSGYNVVTEQLSAASPRAVPTNAGTQMSCCPMGILSTTGSGGTLLLRWAQNTSNATATRVMANSLLMLARVA